MRRHGEGGWVETAARYAARLPEGPGRRQALMLLCNKEERNERVISRMISAREYALKWVDEAEVKASHTTVEMLRTLEGINPAQAASIRMDVLQGRISRPQLDLMMKNLKNESEAMKNIKLSLTLDEVLKRCREDLPFMSDFEWVAPPTDDRGILLGADMEFLFGNAEEGKDGILRRKYEPRWALVVSPHVSCSKIFGSGIKGFVLSTMALCWYYPKVSAFCTSGVEENELLTVIRESDNAGMISRVITHLPSRR